MLSNQRTIPGLDGLRAVSIFLVVAVHTLLSSTLHIDALQREFDINSRLGVLTFFVISGYLITHLLLKEKERTGSVDMRGFYVRRVFRIFPAFYTYLFFILFLRVVGAIITPYPLLASAATFTLNYADAWIPMDHLKHDYRFVGHFWSLSLEEQFYLLWPGILLAVGATRARRALPFFLMLCPVIRVLTYALFPTMRGQIYIMAHTMADPILAGCALALWQGNERFESLVKRLSTPWVPFLAISGAFVISPAITLKMGAPYELTVGILFTSLCLAILVLWTTRYADNLLGRFLNARPVAALGVMSYSLYLWQQLFLTPQNTTWAGRFRLNIVCAFTAALASFYFIERPFLKLRSHFLRKVAISR